jgi:hypothetical protein
VLLESSDPELGHDFGGCPGVYCTPLFETSEWYARPQIMFSDGAFFRIVLEVMVDPGARTRKRKRGGGQEVYPSDSVSVVGLFVAGNCKVRVGEERIDGFDAHLEAVPSGQTAIIAATAVVSPF